MAANPLSPDISEKTNAETLFDNERRGRVFHINLKKLSHITQFCRLRTWIMQNRIKKDVQ